MFGFDITVIAFVGLLMLAAGGLIFFVMFDRVSNDARQEKRVKSIQARGAAMRSKAVDRVAEAAKRKKSVQDSLKDLENKQRERTKKSVGLRKQIQQAGLKMTLQQFVLVSVFSGILFGAVTFLLDAPILVVIPAAFVGALGFPRWVIARMRARRFNQFLEEFPNAVDVVVRGVKAGLPINDCLSIIAREAKDPVATEFRRIIEAQHMGVPLSQAVQRLYDNIPLAESNFFGIVIAIQQSAGGNLSEALGNLANVLRDRKKMKGKIRAMSAEAKASGGIIGALPLVVMVLVYLTTPDYIMLLFTDPTGNIILVCAGMWMTIGILVMKKMINFDF